MYFMTELDEAIKEGLQGFKNYINKKMQKHPDLLEHFFWMPDASQQTILNYLIHIYVEPSETSESESNGLQAMIEYLVNLTKNKNVGTPLHQAVSEGKMQLALKLLALRAAPSPHNSSSNCIFDVDQRDQEGRTLLSLGLARQHNDFLEALLKEYINLHIPTCMGSSGVSFQPIHQAVALNYAAGIRLLAKHGAQLNNRFGPSGDTPVLLAAHLCKINALEALLEQPADWLALDAERSFVSKNNVKQNAIERLCDHINSSQNKADALRGVAMLLCRGAEPPRTETMRQLLTDNRAALLKAIHSYLENRPYLVDSFVNRCHLTESALHNIVYARHSWGSSIRHLFGKPSDTAFIIENLVVRKYSTNSEDSPATLPTAVADEISLETDPLKLYALFVKRYTEAYDNQLITNSWSKMRWMIAEGECDWAKVQRYVATNPRSRSAIVYNEMFKPMPKIHDGLEEDSVELGL